MVPARSALLLALCCLVALAAVAPPAAGQNAPIQSEHPLGDVVEFSTPVPVNGTATVTVEPVGVDEYTRTLRLTDDSGDGRVTLRINTYLGARGATDTAVYGVGDGDTATVRNATGTRLRADTYDIAAYNGTTTEGEPTATSVTRLVPPENGNATVLTAPANATENLTSRAAIRRGRAAGWVTPTDTVAAGDTVVLRLDVDGLDGALAASAGADDTARFLGVFDRANTSLQLQHGFTPMTTVERIPLNRSTVSTAILDERNDTYYVVVDTAAARLTPGTRDGIHDGDSLHVRLLVDGDRRLSEDWIPADHFDIERPAVELGGESHTVSSYPGGRLPVTGETNLAPGSTVTVQLQGASPRLFPRTVTVDRSRQVAVTYHLDPGVVSELTGVTVRHNGERLASAPVTVTTRPTVSTPLPLSDDTPTSTAAATTTSDPPTTGVSGPGLGVVAALAAALLAVLAARKH